MPTGQAVAEREIFQTDIKPAFDEDKIDAAVWEAETQFERDGKLYDARETLSRLRRKYFDKV